MSDEEDRKKANRKVKKYVHKIVKVVRRWDRKAKKLAAPIKKRKNNGS